MTDKNYRAIVDALDLLAQGKPLRSNGKVTAVNVCKEAGMSKATLYRYFDAHTDLRATYDAMRKNGVRLTEDVPETIHQAYSLLKEEVKQLRANLSKVKQDADQANKLKAHQILLLWSENERLQDEIIRLQSRLNSSVNVIPLLG